MFPTSSAYPKAPIASAHQRSHERSPPSVYSSHTAFSPPLSLTTHLKRILLTHLLHPSFHLLVRPFLPLFSIHSLHLVCRDESSSCRDDIAFDLDSVRGGDGDIFVWQSDYCGFGYICRISAELGSCNGGKMSCSFGIHRERRMGRLVCAGSTINRRRRGRK